LLNGAHGIRDARVRFPDISPYVFPKIGSYQIPIRWYALSYIVGIVLGWLYARRLIATPRLWGPKGPPLDQQKLDDLILWITLGVIAGGRLGYVFFYNLPGVLNGTVAARDNMFANPLKIFMLWNGGMSFHGGALGVITALLVFAWRNQIHSLRLGDAVAPAVPIGLFFGRIANFINGELWGRPTHLPWGMVFCNRTIIDQFGDCPAGPLPRHPSQLYESGLEGIVLFSVLWWTTHRTPALQRPGLTTGVFLVGYGLARFSLEHVREPDTFMPEMLKGALTMGMLLSLPMMAVGAWLVWRALKAGPACADAAKPASTGA
jgi:phosphatidylglycerol:prolipoprotein diacylglycerol transferase